MLSIYEARGNQPWLSQSVGAARIEYIGLFLYQQRLISHSSAGWRPKFKVLADSMSVLPLSLQMISFSPIFMCWREVGCGLLAPYKGTSLLMGGSTHKTSSKLNHTSKDPLPNSIIVSIRATTYACWEDTFSP